MLLTRIVVWMFSGGLMVLGADMARGQNYPNKPIRMVTSEAGGGSDFAARLIAQGLTGSLGQQVVVENRGGASGIIALETVAKAPPDGHTLLFYSNGLWLLPFMQSVPYDSVKDFAPVSLSVSSPNILVVHPSVPAKSVKELVVLAKARPGELNYATGSAGSPPHLAAEMFKGMVAVDIVRIPYKGAGPALNALIGGQVQLMFATAGSVMQHVKSDRLRALAVTSAQPSDLLPGLPTIAASGLPGYKSITIYGMFAPAGTPAVTVNRLSNEIRQVVTRPDVKERFFNSGVEPAGSTPEEFAAVIKSEMAVLGKVIKDAGIRAD